MKYKKTAGNQNHHLFQPYDKTGELRKVYWVRFYRAGRGRLEESLKTENLGEARIARDKRMAEFLGERPKFQGKVFLVEDKFPEFLELKSGKAEKTRVSMKLQWEKHIAPHFGGLILDEVTESEWLRYVAKKRIASPDRKFFNDRKYLAMFLNWAHRDGLIAKVPRFEDVDPERNAGKVYTTDEIASLLKCASPLLELQILMAVTMGMRKGEILRLEWAQIDFGQCTIHLPAAKTKIRKARTFGISSQTIELLKARKASSKSAWVFPSPDDLTQPVGESGNQTAWETCKRNANVIGRFHDLRHTFLTRAFKSNAQHAALICHYAGLSLEEANRTYLHFDVDDTRVVASLVAIGV